MRIQKTTIAELLKKMKGIVPPKTLDGMQGILIKDNQMIATNLNLTVTATIEETADEPFIIPQTAVPYIESLPFGWVEIIPKKKYITIKGENTSAKFTALEAENFPNTNPKGESTGSETVIPGKKLKEALSGVWYAADANAKKVNARGILLEGDGENLNLVASDGFRASWSVIKHDAKFKVFVPKDSFKTAISFVDDDDDITITPYKNDVCITSDRFSIQMKLLEGSAIPYKSVFDFKKQKIAIKVSTKELISCISRCAACMVSKVSTPAVMTMQKGGDLTITQQNSSSEFSESVPILSEQTCDISMGFNAAYMLEALKNCEDEQVTLYYCGNLTPMLIAQSKSSLIHLIVPMRFVAK